MIAGPMTGASGTGTVVAVKLIRMGLALALAVTPATATLLATTAEPRLTAPPGAAAWEAAGLPDPVTTDPVAVHRLIENEPQLAAEYPGVVGALDGAPAGLRYAANQAAGAPKTGQFLLYDARGDGLIVQVFGDLSTADRIAVLVPGAGNRLANFFRGVGGKSFRSPAVQADALWKATADKYVAVIAWLGYDTPDGLDATAAREDLAATGAVTLERFVAGLATTSPQATITLIGYSYGSTVIGLAAHLLPPRVTDIAVVGSPGMGVDTVAQLHTTARVWAGLSTRDTMRKVPGVRLFGLGHGRQPADPAFGARVFRTDDVVDHDHYLFPGTASLATLADIARTGDEATP